MKFIVSILVIAILSYAACLYLPWWSVAVTSLIVAALLRLPAGSAFLAGFIAIFILWIAISFMLSNNNGHLLAHKVSLLIIKVDNPFLLIFITAIIGAIAGGLGALTGAYLRAPRKTY